MGQGASGDLGQLHVFAGLSTKSELGFATGAALTGAGLVAAAGARRQTRRQTRRPGAMVGMAMEPEQLSDTWRFFNCESEEIRDEGIFLVIECGSRQ